MRNHRLRIYIWGTIASDETKLPGVVITAESTATGKSISTVSDDQGHYRLAVSAPGTYRVRAELFGFSPADRVLSVADHEAQADFRLALAVAESTEANHHLQAAPSAAANEPPPQASRGGGDAKRSLPLSADMPTDFSFVTGQLAQPAAAADVGGEAPLRRSPVHFNASYQAANSALDASPYALHGIAAAKPEWAQNTFGAGLGGTLPRGKSASYFGSRSGNPYSGFATVPTAAMRAGDFSGLPPAGSSVAV